MAKKEEADKEEEAKAPTTLPEILRAFPSAPSQEQIESWKAKYGDIYVSGFSETELFVFRAITRPEWVALQARAADPESKMDNFKFEETVCEICVIWKSIPTSWSQCKAGIPTAIQEQVLQNSCFVTPQAASMLCAKL